MGVNHNILNCDKVGVRSLGSSISSYKNISNRILQNDAETFVLLFERL